MVEVPIPGQPALTLRHVLCDVNGTLTDRGDLIAGVEPRIVALRDLVEVHLVSADTFGTLDDLARRLQVRALRVTDGEEKLSLLMRLGAEGCAVVGNGRNDALAMQAAGLGVAVVGPEGASAAAVRAADVICSNIHEALDLLRDPKALSATLRV